MSTHSYLIGLDLGQAKDPTALVVVDRLLKQAEKDAAGRVVYDAAGRLVFVAFYHVIHLERFPLGTRYTTIADRVKGVCDAGMLKDAPRTLLVDATGVGRPEVDLLRERLGQVVYLMPITSTSGNQVTRSELGGYNVPKGDLVGAVRVLMETERFKVAEGLPEAATLVNELQNFRVKITPNANATYEAWREGDHDDEVFATALACWYGENYEPKAPPIDTPPPDMANSPYAAWVKN